MEGRAGCSATSDWAAGLSSVSLQLLRLAYCSRATTEWPTTHPVKCLARYLQSREMQHKPSVSRTYLTLQHTLITVRQSKAAGGEQQGRRCAGETPQAVTKRMHACPQFQTIGLGVARAGSHRRSSTSTATAGSAANEDKQASSSSSRRSGAGAHKKGFSKL